MKRSKSGDLMVPGPGRGESPFAYAFRALAELAEPEYPNALEHECGWRVTFIDEKRAEAEGLLADHRAECGGEA